MPAAERASRGRPAVGEAQRQLGDRLRVFADELPGQADREAGRVGIRTPLPQQPVALVGDRRVLRPPLAVEVEGEAHRLRRAHGSQVDAALGRVAPEAFSANEMRNQRAATSRA